MKKLYCLLIFEFTASTSPPRASKLREKKDKFRKRKEERISKEEYMRATRHYGAVIRQAKVQCELVLARGALYNKKNLYEYVGSNLKIKGAIGPLLGLKEKL